MSLIHSFHSVFSCFTGPGTYARYSMWLHSLRTLLMICTILQLIAIGLYCWSSSFSDQYISYCIGPAFDWQNTTSLRLNPSISVPLFTCKDGGDDTWEIDTIYRVGQCGIPILSTDYRYGCRSTGPNEYLSCPDICDGLYFTGSQFGLIILMIYHIFHSVFFITGTALFVSPWMIILTAVVHLFTSLLAFYSLLLPDRRMVDWISTPALFILGVPWTFAVLIHIKALNKRQSNQPVREQHNGNIENSPRSVNDNEASGEPVEEPEPAAELRLFRAPVPPHFWFRFEVIRCVVYIVLLILAIVMITGSDRSFHTRMQFIFQSSSGGLLFSIAAIVGFAITVRIALTLALDKEFAEQYKSDYCIFYASEAMISAMFGNEQDDRIVEFSRVNLQSSSPSPLQQSQGSSPRHQSSPSQSVTIPISDFLDPVSTDTSVANAGSVESAGEEEIELELSMNEQHSEQLPL